MFQPGTRLHYDRYTILKPLGHGGFSQTFEVDDQGTVKVLKVLLESYPKAVDLFQREFKVLSQLSHPGIPAVDSDGYFMVPSPDPSQLSHCLVMERIPGMDLRKWLYLRQEAPLEEPEALDWLAQLTEILAQLHRHHCFHRDIKPSNIMLRPDGQLVLIDFGAVREVTETFLDKQAGDITRTHLYSRGYTPMEQMQGRAVPESDFFALGRTFVHLLTGCNPLDFSTDPETGTLLWREYAPHISVALADMLDQLMAPFVAKRPHSPEAIASMVATVQSQIAANQSPRIGDLWPTPSSSRPSSHNSLTPENLTRPPSLLDDIDLTAGIDDLGTSLVSGPTEWTLPLRPRWRRWWQRCWRPWGRSIVCGGLITAGVTGLRLLGLFQSLELQTFDQLMRWRSPEPLDSRIVLVTISSDDITYQNAQGWVRQGSLADEALSLLLAKLQQYHPRLIGLDIYRSSADLGIAPSGDVAFRDALGQYDNLVAVCAVGGGNQNHPAIAPPQEVPLDQIGFSNIPYDADGRVRRQLIGMTPDSTCDTSWSLSSQLALRYLMQENFTVDMEEQTLRIGDRHFPRLYRQVGGYQHPAQLNGGYQLLLNYRSQPSLAPQITLSALLEAEQDNTLADVIANRVVLIGTTDRSYGDYHPTPYGDLPGVVIQGHMVSQLLAAMLDNRPLLWGLPPWGDGLWMLVWSLVASMLVGMGRSPWQSIGAVLLLVLSLTGISFVLLLQGGWMPLIPSVISIVLTTGVILWLLPRPHPTRPRA